MIEHEVVDYIFQFLSANESIDASGAFAYCKENEIPVDKKIIIIKSNLFDEKIYATKQTIPQLPLKQINGIPLLYGADRIERHGGQIILYADLIASTYFLISRYEEIVRPEIRDKYGRFPGRESLPYRAGFIDRPVVDEYGRLLRGLMREVGINAQEPRKKYSNIYLTHDIDTPWEQFNAVSAIRRVMGNLKREWRWNLYPIRNWIGCPEKDPQYTFDEIIRLDKILPEATSIYFIKSGGNIAPEDGPIYIYTKAFKRLQKKLTDANALLGYHASYEAGQNPNLIQKEIEILQKIVGQKINFSRNHYLLSRDPSDYNELMNSGITDDFTMGYADVAGFRLGTSHSVRWIDPRRTAVTSLTLHPLNIMDCSLLDAKYMALSMEAAIGYLIRLVNQIHEFDGEVCLLWHNTCLMPYRREARLYLELLKYLSTQKD